MRDASEQMLQRDTLMMVEVGRPGTRWCWSEAEQWKDGLGGESEPRPQHGATPPYGATPLYGLKFSPQ